jgi:thiol-disulfide isomerase/thioredoxin
VFKKYLIQIGNKYQNLEGQKNILPGSSAPDFNLKSFQGEDFFLSKYYGKYIVLDFWATWCSPCIKGLPKMKEYYEKYRTRVEFVGIACNDKEHKWREYLSKNELPWINLLNNENEVPNVSSLYGASSLPTKVIIDPEGKIVTIIKGESEEFYEILDKIIPVAQKSNE